jgi:hypothetical protein
MPVISAPSAGLAGVIFMARSPIGLKFCFYINAEQSVRNLKDLQ